MKRIQYSSSLDIKKQLAAVYANDPHNHDDAYELSVLYILYKSGLIEDGINQIQLNAAFDAFIDASNAMAELIDAGVAHDE